MTLGFYGPVNETNDYELVVEMLTGPREPTLEELWELEHAERRHLNDLLDAPAMPVSVARLVPSSIPLGDGTTSWKDS